MLALVLRSLRRRRGRAAALVLGIAAATAAFTVLTGATRTARLEARGEVSRQFRTAYDVLVRPPGAVGPVERREGLVEPTTLTAMGGGISMDQLARIRRTPGVEVAAPLAIFGQLVVDAPLRVPLGRFGERAIYRTRTTWSADNGLTTIHDPPSYTYVTRHLLSSNDRPTAFRFQSAVSAESLPGGDRQSICPYEHIPHSATGPFAPVVRTRIACWSTQSGLEGLARGDFGPGPESAQPGKLAATVPFAFAVPLAGVDPAAEAALSGSRRTVVSGRALRPSDHVRLRGRQFDVPVVLSQVAPADVQARVRLERLPTRVADRIPTPIGAKGLRRLLSRSPGRRIRLERLHSQEAYARLVDGLRRGTSDAFYPSALWAVDPVRFDVSGPRAITAVPARRQDREWADYSSFGGSAGYLNPPISARDRPYRRIKQHLYIPSDKHPGVHLRLVGTSRASPARGPSAVLDPFDPPALRGATGRDRSTLGGRPLAPDGNPAGLLGLPPLALTSLDARSVFFNDLFFNATDHNGPEPVSSVRVRVADVHGADEASRERLRLVAERIRASTGLRVDITAGASPSPVRLALPAGDFGRPALSLEDPWVLKGVAVAVLSAVDRKGVLLFALVLVVCSLFCAGASAAAVRERSTELAVLACLGWPRRALVRLLLTEVTVLGGLAGVLGQAIALPVGHATGLDVSPLRALLTVPAATALAVAATAWPLVRATRPDPLDAVRPPVRRSRRTWPIRSVARLAVANTLSSPGRTALGALCLAVGVMALTLLLAVILAFRGAVVGTVLGDTVSVQVHATDYASVALTLGLGVIGLADVLYLNVRERAAELAALRATGWPERSLVRLIAIEGLLVGLLGGVAGATAGLVAAGLFTGRGLGALAGPAGGGVAAGAVCAAIASIAPVLLLRRLPTAAALARE